MKVVGRSGPLHRALSTFAWTAAFALSYAQSPLYTSNQNQYFLHGLARAGLGYLRDDWLVHTAEPTPVFTWIVQGMISTLPAWTFYLLYAALMGVYLHSLLAIAASVFDLRAPAKRTLMLAALVIMHSAALRYLLARLVSPEAEFLLEGGVAGQRLLGAVLQPSAFGVFLVLSVALFLRERRLAAVVALGAACLVHPTYLLSAGVLLATYVVMTAWRPEQRRQAVVMALVGAAVLAPVTAWAYVSFRPSGADLYARAVDILIRLRLPHHAIPIKWLDAGVAAQTLIVVAALALVHRSRLFVLILVGTIFVAVSTAAQMAGGDPTLALLFPWRLSTVLIPISTTCIAAAMVAGGLDRWGSRPRLMRWVHGVALAAVGLAAAAGIYRFWAESEAQRTDRAAPMMAFVAVNLTRGDVYFIDPKLQDFRLRTGAPIVVEAKAIPYRADEVTAWYDRLKVARNFFRSRPQGLNCGILATAAGDFGATHVVLSPQQLGLECPQLEEQFNDGAYAVYRIRAGG